LNTRQLSREALGILAIGASFFLLASLFSYDMSDDPARVFPVAEKPLNLGGLTGFVVARALFSAFGVAGAYGAGVLLLLFALASLSLREPSRGLCQATFGALGLILAIACGERLAVGLELPFFGLIQEDLSGRLAGGAWGTFIVHWVARSFSPLAPLLLVAIGASMGGALVFDYLQDLGSNLDELEPVTRAEDEEASWDLGEIFEAPGLSPRPCRVASVADQSR
jgi:hypothetical protein